MPFDRNPSSSIDDEDVDVSAFRRVHVIPFEGDLLRSLVRIGSEYRDVVLHYSSHFEPNSPRLPPETVVEFKRLVQDLNDLKSTGIYPLAELSARQGTTGHKEALEQWIKRTAQVVYHSLIDPLLRARVSPDEIRAISQWLSDPAPPSPAISTNGRAKFTLRSFRDDYCRNQHVLRFATRQTKFHPPSTPLMLHGGSEWELLSTSSDEPCAAEWKLDEKRYE
ncbi:hypothetical protein H9Q70_006085 [Fusarium xylarioides]|nr:hypothetical protein H9Q70_006085 [Fusarium xylarioides]